MKEQDLRDKFKAWLDTEPHNLFRDTQCVQIAKDYAEQEAIDFGRWMHENTVKDAKFYTVILE